MKEDKNVSINFHGTDYDNFKRSADSLLAKTETPRIGGWLQTFSGIKFYPLDPHPEEVTIEDVAHGLSNLCRFAGQCQEFYSVAQHCVLVAQALEEELGATSEECFQGLLHDAAEAYVVDLPRPVKHDPRMGSYREIEKKVFAAIATRFDIPSEEYAIVKTADNRMLATEARDILGPTPEVWQEISEPFIKYINPWSPNVARNMFLAHYQYLMIATGRAVGHCGVCDNSLTLEGKPLVQGLWQGICSNCGGHV